MIKYGSTLIHRGRDRFGDIEVVENRLERTLHFGTSAKQSSMDLRDPMRLALSYTRAMAATLLFHPEPRRALVIGLGGASLPKFLLHHYPACRVDAVEVREQVYHVARAYFALPDDPRLSVTIEDGAAFLADQVETHYDLLLVDAFLAGGVADSVCGQTFLEDCRRVMTDDGVMAFNLWSDDRVSLADQFDAVADTFGGPALRLPVEGKDNIIGLIGPGGLHRNRLRRLDDAAKALEARLDIEYPALLRRLRRSNRSLF